jgi:enoyl-CoA hydratase/carnithine racemase
VDLHDLGALVGPAGETTIAAASVLEAAEPLVLHVDRDPGPEVVAEVVSRLRRTPAVVVVVAGDPTGVPPALAAAADIALCAPVDPPAPWHDGPLDAVRERVAAQPLAGLALASLLRVSEGRPVWDAVAAEASTYGMLLGSAAHQRWLCERGAPAATRTDAGGPPVVDVRRVGGRLVVALDRPAVHNALDTALRDQLVAALDGAAADPAVAEIDLRGHGPSFSAGGDLGEFGTVPDAATSYAVRLTRHPGLAVHRVAGRTTAHVHGHCIGAGIEIAAFALRVVADPGSRFRLPELGMGLVPGAGGTVSVARRIGRQRACWLALTGAELDAATAVRWGLVDEVRPRSAWPPPAPD